MPTGFLFSNGKGIEVNCVKRYIVIDLIFLVLYGLFLVSKLYIDYPSLLITWLSAINLILGVIRVAVYSIFFGKYVKNKSRESGEQRNGSAP